MKQAEKIFMISDAAKQVEVEAHVLRYWEEELQLPVKRNEMGHRYYTGEDIMLFRKIKELKEQGLQLKAIRNMIKKGVFKESMLALGKRDAEDDNMEELPGRQVIMVKKGELMQNNSAALQEETKEQKSLRLQQLLRDMIVEAVQTNNQEICEEIKESLLKELDYQFRLQEEKEDIREVQRMESREEHYRQIDELIRSYNHKEKKTQKKEKANEAQPERNRTRLFFRKNPEEEKQKKKGEEEEKVLQTGNKEAAKEGTEKNAEGNIGQTAEKSTKRFAIIRKRSI